MLKHSLKEIVSNSNPAKISYVCQGVVYYNIEVEDSTYQLGIDSMKDEWQATFLHSDFRAINLMRWIRKAIETETLIQLK